MKLGDWAILCGFIALLTVMYVLPWFGWDPVGTALDRGFASDPWAIVAGIALLAIVLLILAVRRFRRTGELGRLVWAVFLCTAVFGVALYTASIASR